MEGQAAQPQIAGLQRRGAQARGQAAVQVGCRKAGGREVGGCRALLLLPLSSMHADPVPLFPQPRLCPLTPFRWCDAVPSTAAAGDGGGPASRLAPDTAAGLAVTCIADWPPA